MASLIYNAALNKTFTGTIDYDSDSFKVMLVTLFYVPDKDAHDFRDDVTSEVVGAGYTAGGMAVTVSVTNDTANDRQDVSLGTASWVSSTITAKGAVYYKARGGLASADEIIAYIDFGGNISSNNGTFALSASTIRVQN